MIASGEKKEEYREDKDYWYQRLCETYGGTKFVQFKDFDIIRFKNGYGKNAPTMDVECKEIYYAFGREEWGAKDKLCYVIELGAILSPPITDQDRMEILTGGDK